MFLNFYTFMVPLKFDGKNGSPEKIVQIRKIFKQN